MPGTLQCAPPIHEISVKGRKLFVPLSEELEGEHKGKAIVIEVDSGDYFIADIPIEANRKAKEKYPDKVFYLGRIGYRTAYTFKGRR